jgi:hypothetical protein
MRETIMDISIDFGLLLAYFLPGIIAVKGLSYVFDDVNKLINKVEENSKRLNSLVLLITLTLFIGLLLSLTRHALLIPTFKIGFCKTISANRSEVKSWPPYYLMRVDHSRIDYGKLTQDKILQAYKLALSNERRYYQFYGNSFFAILVFVIARLFRYGKAAKKEADKCSFIKRLIEIHVVFGIFLLLYFACKAAYARFVEATYKKEFNIHA